MEVNNVIIIGAGCAGLTAAIYCGRAELNPIVFSGNFEVKGGLLTKTSVVENYPGFENGIMGSDLVDNMEKQAVKYNAKIINKDVVSVDFGKDVFAVTDDSDTTYYSKTVIIATGSTPNKLYLENEDKFWSKGISSCAVCDGALYKNKNIVVVGGGDSAIEEALFLTKFSNVTLIHRRDVFRASKIMQNRLLANKKVKVIYNSVIAEIKGDEELQEIVVKNIVNNETVNMQVDGLFYGLGLKPNTKLFENKLELDDEGFIIKKHETETSIKGVFVAGDVADKVYKQAVIASGDGCKAALDVCTYLATIK